MSNHTNTKSSQNLKVYNANHSPGYFIRLKIALQAIGGRISLTHIADKYGVSRKFVYKHRDLALKAIANVFQKALPDKNDDVLFYLPVTKKWLTQVVLALIFICRGSYQSIVEFFRDMNLSRYPLYPE